MASVTYRRVIRCLSWLVLVYTTVRLHEQGLVNSASDLNTWSVGFVIALLGDWLITGRHWRRLDPPARGQPGESVLPQRETATHTKRNQYRAHPNWTSTDACQHGNPYLLPTYLVQPFPGCRPLLSADVADQLHQWVGRARVLPNVTPCRHHTMTANHVHNGDALHPLPKGIQQCIFKDVHGMSLVGVHEELLVTWRLLGRHIGNDLLHEHLWFPVGWMESIQGQAFQRMAWPREIQQTKEEIMQAVGFACVRRTLLRQINPTRPGHPCADQLEAVVVENQESLEHANTVMTDCINAAYERICLTMQDMP